MGIMSKDYREGKHGRRSKIVFIHIEMFSTRGNKVIGDFFFLVLLISRS